MSSRVGPTSTPSSSIINTPGDPVSSSIAPTVGPLGQEQQSAEVDAASGTSTTTTSYHLNPNHLQEQSSQSSRDISTSDTKRDGGGGGGGGDDKLRSVSTQGDINTNVAKGVATYQDSFYQGALDLHHTAHSNNATNNGSNDKIVPKNNFTIDSGSLLAKQPDTVDAEVPPIGVQRVREVKLEPVEGRILHSSPHHLVPSHYAVETSDVSNQSLSAERYKQDEPRRLIQLGKEKIKYGRAESEHQQSNIVNGNPANAHGYGEVIEHRTQNRTAAVSTESENE